jgi:hypothetical protein
MSDGGLGALVKDWGGFEELVAKLHETGAVTVERDVTLTGKSGAARQIDVLVRHKQDLYEHKVIVECKYWNQPVERLHVDALVTTVREVGADRGVIFSSKGFQSGAVTQAKQDGIELFTVRQPTDVEWGLPGRHFDMWLHLISTSVGNVQPAQAYWIGLPIANPPPLNIELGRDDIPGTPIRAHGRPSKTLEELITTLAHDSAKQAYNPVTVQFNDGTYCGEIRFLINVNYAPLKPMEILRPGGLLIVPKFSFQVGVLVRQSRIQIDRGQNFAFLLAVEDCIRRSVTAASRKKDSELTVLTPLQPAEIPNSELAYKNGSICQVWVKGYEAFTEFAALEPGRALLKATPASPPVPPPNIV